MVAVVTTVDMRGLALLLLDAAILAVVVLRPSRATTTTRTGIRSLVLMVPPLRPSYPRFASFLAVSFLVSVLLVGLRSRTIVDDYYPWSNSSCCR